MQNPDEYVDIYTGTEVNIVLLKGLLEEEGIPHMVQNGYGSGNIGGFVGGTPTTVKLKVRRSDYDRARSITEQFESNRIPS